MSEEPRTLDARARAVYRVRGEHPRLADHDLAERLGVPVDEVRESQRELVALRLLEPLDAGGWAVRSPDVAADQLLAGDMDAMHALQRRLSATRADLTALTSDYLEARRLTSIAASIETVSGVEAVRVVIQDLSSLAETSVDNMAPGGGAPQEALDAALPLALAALGRGVALRSLFQHPARTHQVTNRYLRRLLAAGGQVRTAPILPSRMILVDGTVAVIPLQHGASEAGAVVVRHDAVVGVLRDLFETYWADAAAFTEETSIPGAHRPSDLQLAVVRLLAAGKKDEVIAREIGLSVRSTRRIIAETMLQLGARSRFEAGVQVIARGWLSPVPPADPTSGGRRSPRAT